MLTINYENHYNTAMRGPSENSRQIRDFLLRSIAEGAEDLVARTGARFQLSRQAIHRHLRALQAADLVDASGKTRGRRYALAVLERKSAASPLAGLEEHRLWQDTVAPWFSDLPEPARRIWAYGFSEMVNNAVDHSEGRQLDVWMEKDAVAVRMGIVDDGVGIFSKIQRALSLGDERQAVLELAKGKLTTDPARHTGEGIFFASRAFDEFTILSGGTAYLSEFAKPEDWVMERKQPEAGTVVLLKLYSDTRRSLPELFDAFRGRDGDFGFKRTVVPVRLLQYGEEQLVSRSQARRLLARFERFDVVALDFAGIEMIGQAFADEIFRVFARAHPDTSLEVANESPEVHKSIQRVLAGAAEEN